MLRDQLMDHVSMGANGAFWEPELRENTTDHTFPIVCGTQVLARGNLVFEMTGEMESIELGGPLVPQAQVARPEWKKVAHDIPFPTSCSRIALPEQKGLCIRQQVFPAGPLPDARTRHAVLRKER